MPNRVNADRERIERALEPLRALNPRSRWMRWSRKLVFASVVAILVLYPKPWLLARHVQRSLNLAGLIEPGADGLAAVQQDALDSLAKQGLPPTAQNHLIAVERAVYRRWPYAYDWQTWGVANYLPTVAETMRLDRCDCKGRAVVAASVLARMGYTPHLVSDLSHLWVWTPEGEAMGPVRTRSGRRLIDANEQGNRLDLGALLSAGGLFTDLPARLGFSLSVFPPLRSGLLIVTLWVILLNARPRWSLALSGLGAMGLGALALGLGCARVEQASLIAAWGGIALLSLGVGLAWLSGRGPKRGERTLSSASA